MINQSPTSKLSLVMYVVVSHAFVNNYSENQIIHDKPK